MYGVPSVATCKAEYQLGRTNGLSHIRDRERSTECQASNTVALFFQAEKQAQTFAKDRAPLYLCGTAVHRLSRAFPILATPRIGAPAMSATLQKSVKSAAAFLFYLASTIENDQTKRFGAGAHTHC
jgi:hypothetical protein